MPGKENSFISSYDHQQPLNYKNGEAGKAKPHQMKNNLHIALYERKICHFSQKYGLKMN